MSSKKTIVEYKANKVSFEEEEISHLPEWQRLFTLKYKSRLTGIPYYTPAYTFTAEITAKIITYEQI